MVTFVYMGEGKMCSSSKVLLLFRISQFGYEHFQLKIIDARQKFILTLEIEATETKQSLEAILHLVNTQMLNTQE